ncbi:hypothetical protein HYV91_00520 [Candidatus Wolfebacteria bacterium]|nr:hypothetical protein [Candidatus Wolfebacteria bacterium]
MQSNLVKIKFHFPNLSRKIRNKREVVDLLMEAMQRNGDIKYAGYLKEKDLHKDLLRHIGSGDITLYSSLSVKQKKAIEKTIYGTIKKCHKTLPHPDLPIFAFVYPWFPKTNDRALFGGIMALAAYYTIHLFVDLSAYTQKSLKQTIAHEWNHLVFYRHHPARQYTLCDHIIMEGFAEAFREEMMGGKPAPWALALTKKEAKKQLGLLKKRLNTKGVKIYREVFFGNKKYKRWTGYSIGYWLIKEFRKRHPKLSWEEIIKTKPENILLEAVIKRRA